MRHILFWRKLMIGAYAPAERRWRRASAIQDPTFQNLRQELRRGCLALAVLAELRHERYGYALRQALADSGIQIEQGTLYPLLRRLQSQGLLFSEWRHEGRRRKRFYGLTPHGRAVLEELLTEWKRIGLCLESVLTGPHYEAA